MGIEKNKDDIRGIRFIIIKIMMIIFLLFSISLFLFSFLSKNEISKIEKNQNIIVSNSLESLVQKENTYYNSILIDYSCFSWMVDFIKFPQNYKPEEYITATNEMGLSIFQVFDLQKNTVYCSNTGLINNDTIVFNDLFYKKLYQNRTLNFFMKYDTLVIEIHASTIHNSEDTKKEGKPNGYLIIGKLWNQAYINEIKTIINANIFIESVSIKRTDLTKSQIIKTFNDYKGNRIASMYFQSNSILKKSTVLPQGFIEYYTIIIFILVVIVGLFFFEYTIYKPLKTLYFSFKYVDVKNLEPILSKKNEFSTMAKMIKEFFEQVEWAQKEITDMQRTKDELKNTYDALLTQKNKTEIQNNVLEIQSEKLAVAHQEIIIKNNQLEFQNAQITDGIKYASMIQKAVLTPQFNVEKLFNDHFIFFKPKEILSGDFYWFKEFFGKYYFACADCTGHGFSGAMMSMLGISFLNELTHHQNDKHITPSIMLDKLRIKLVETLHQTGKIGQIRDGMDISLCMYNPESKSLDFAGAYNILYHVRRNEDESVEIVEYKGDRMPVGIYDNPVPFTNFTIPLKENDTIYLLTDGYIDQFGGINKKKLNKQNFKNIILSIQHLTLSEQRTYIKEYMINWIGELDQVDDITILGIKF